MRDSKDTAGPVLAFARAEWRRSWTASGFPVTITEATGANKRVPGWIRAGGPAIPRLCHRTAPSSRTDLPTTTAGGHPMTARSDFSPLMLARGLAWDIGLPLAAYYGLHLGTIQAPRTGTQHAPPSARCQHARRGRQWISRAVLSTRRAPTLDDRPEDLLVPSRDRPSRCAPESGHLAGVLR
jgi:hypothetical protein